MKSDIHPKTHEVIFLDISSGAKFITQSTLGGEETEKLNGKEYKVVKVEISSDTHPFYTGKQKLLDASGRVDKFNERRKKAQAVAQTNTGSTADAEEMAKNSAEEAEETAE